jgi:AcrR family transcriptional regulator
MTNNQLNVGWHKHQQMELKTIIFETSLRLFRDQGVEKTTVQQIASTVGIGKGTFFNHFPSKDHVLQEWYRRLTRTALKEVSDKTFDSGRDAVLGLVLHLALDASRDSDLWDAKVSATSNPLLRQEENDLNEEVFDFCKNSIERDIRDDRRDFPITAEFATDLILAVITGTAHIWSISGHPEDLVKILEEQINFVLDAALLHK